MAALLALRSTLLHGLVSPVQCRRLGWTTVAVQCRRLGWTPVAVQCRRLAVLSAWLDPCRLGVSSPWLVPCRLGVSTAWLDCRLGVSSAWLSAVLVPWSGCGPSLVAGPSVWLVPRSGCGPLVWLLSLCCSGGAVSLMPKLRIVVQFLAGCSAADKAAQKLSVSIPAGTPLYPSHHNCGVSHLHHISQIIHFPSP